MTVSVRSADPADAPAVAKLLTQLGYPTTDGEVARRLGYWRKDPVSQVLVAVRSDGQVTGCLSLHAIPYLERTGRWARVESLIVDEGNRGCGLGRALLEAAESTAREWGCLSVEVATARERPGALPFFQRMGYADACAESARLLKPLE